jgi:hypothetical protein
MRNIQRDFLWGNSKNKKKWALVAWEITCLPKLKGSMGLRDLETLSQILGANIWWRWLTNPHSQWDNSGKLNTPKMNKPGRSSEGTIPLRVHASGT